MTKVKPSFEIKGVPIEGTKWMKKAAIHEFNLPDGSQGRWESINEGDVPTMLLCGLTPDKKLVLANLFRFPANAFCHELPGGVVEPGESVEDAALREFLEETGYVPGGAISKLCSGFLYNGKSNKKFEVWLGENCVKQSDITIDKVEVFAQLTVEELSVPEIKERILSGDNSFDPPIAMAILALEAKGIV